MSDAQKRLEVSLAYGTVVFTEKARKTTNRWANVVVDHGHLIVTRPDGTKRTFAPGQWLEYSTEFVL